MNGSRFACGIVLAGLLAPSACGGDDEGDRDTTAPSTGPAAVTTSARPAGLTGEAAEAADVVVQFLEQPSGKDACFALVGTEYADSLGGQESCARRFDPLVTGDFNTIASVRVVKPGREAVAEVAPSGGGRRVTLRLARATTGWRIDGASGLPG